MKILVLNSILFTADNNSIPQVASIKDTMIYNMCLGFKKAGHDVTLAAADEYRPLNAEKYDFDVLFFRSALKKIFPPSVLPFSLSLGKYLKQSRNRFDLVVSSEVFSFPSLFASLLCPGKTVIWHELAVHQRKFHGLPSRFWYNVVARFFERRSLVIPRSGAAGLFIKRYMPRVSADFVDHGINTDNFIYKKEKENQFIVVAQLIPRKNISSIIDKFAKFIAKYNLDYQLLIVGRGELRGALQSQIDTLKLTGRVVLTGFKSHSELRMLLADSRAMLVDTLQDDNMVSIPEAIVCGTPVLTNNIPTTFVAAKGVGVQKEWNEDDIFAMTKNDDMIGRCAVIRKELSNEFLADKMIRLWKDQY